jgi:hypothetical protein
MDTTLIDVTRSSSGPPPELAALLAHVASSLPLEAPAAPT